MECIFEGSLTSADLQEAYNARIDFGDGEAFRNIDFLVSDYTKASLNSVKSSDIEKQVVGNYSRARNINPDFITIGIVPGLLEYGMSRMFQGFASEAGASAEKVYVVRNRDEFDKLIGKLQADFS